MANPALRDAIGRNISINVETIPQNKTLNESNSTPLHVRIKLHNKDDVLSRKFYVSKTKAALHADKGIKQCCSEQTILSFNLLVEPNTQTKETKPRKRFFNRLLPNACMGVQISDDENPYLPSQTRRRESDTTQHTESSKDRDHNTRKNKKKKFRPGGCLDPTFSEENCSYKPTSKIYMGKKDDNTYAAQKKQNLLTNADKGENKSIHSLYQATNAKSSGLITYPHHLKDNKEKKSLSSERTRKSSTFSQSAQYYFGQRNDKTDADNAKQSTDSQKLTREFLSGPIMADALLAQTHTEKQSHKEEIEPRNIRKSKNNKKAPKQKRKYKSGGCLDPHVSDDEDNYSYVPSKKKIIKESDGISLITDIYKDEVGLKKRELVKEPSQTKISLVTDVRSDGEIKLGDKERSDSVQSTIKRKSSAILQQNSALASTSGVTTGAAIGTIAGVVRTLSKENNTEKNKYEQDGEHDSEYDDNKNKLNDQGHHTSQSHDFKPKNKPLHKLESKKSQPEREYFSNRIIQLSKSKLSIESIKGAFKKKTSITKSNETTIQKNQLGIELLNDSSDTVISRISRETSKKSILEGKLIRISPEREKNKNSNDTFRKEILRSEIAQSSKDLRDFSPKHPQESTAEAGSHTKGKSKVFKDHSQKSSPKRLSFELLQKRADNKMTKKIPERKSSKDVNSAEETTDFHKDKNKISSPVRLSDIQFAESQLRKWSPERRSSKDNDSAKEISDSQRDQVQKSSPVRLSDIQFAESQLRKWSPERKSSKDTYIAKQISDSQRDQVQKSSPVRLSDIQFAESQLRKWSPERKSSKDTNSAIQIADSQRDQVQKSSPVRLSDIQFAESQLRKWSPERKSSKDTNSAIQIADSQRDQVQKSSPVQLSYDQFAQSQLRKLSPERKSIKVPDKFKETADLYKDLNKKSSSVRLSNIQFAESQLRKMSPERKSNKDTHNVNENADLNKDQNQKSGPVRLSSNQFAESQLKQISPERRGDKDTNNGNEKTEFYKDQKISLGRISDNQFAESQVRKLSPEQKSNKEKYNLNENVNFLKDQNQKPPLEKLSANKFAESQLRKLPLEQRSNKDTYSVNENTDFHKDQIQKPSSGRLSDNQFAESQLREVSPERKSNKGTFKVKENADFYKDQTQKLSSGRLSDNQFAESQLSKVSPERKSNKDTFKVKENADCYKDETQKSSSGRLTDNQFAESQLKNLPLEQRINKDTYNENENTEFHNDEIQKPSSGRLSDYQFAEIQLKKLSPERRNNKDTYNVIENVDIYKGQTQKPSSGRLSDNHFAVRQLRKLSPERKSNIDTYNENTNLHKDQNQRSSSESLADITLRKRSPDRKSKTTNGAQENTDFYKQHSRNISPKRLSFEFVDNVAENNLLNRSPDHENGKNIYDIKEHTRKSSPSRLSSEFFEDIDDNQSNTKSPKIKDDDVIKKYTAGNQLINADNNKSDAILPISQSRRSSKQSTSDFLRRTVERFSNISIKRSPERKSSNQQPNISNSNIFINENITPKGRIYEQNAYLINKKSEVLEDKLFYSRESRKMSPQKSTDVFKDTSDYLDSSISNKNIHSSNNSGPNLTIRISKDEFPSEDKSSTLEFTQKQNMQKTSSDFLRKSINNNKHSASMSSFKYRNPLVISDPENFEDDLKDATYDNISEKQKFKDELNNDNPNYQDENDFQNKTFISIERKPEMYKEYDDKNEIFEGNDNDINFVQKHLNSASLPANHQSNIFMDGKTYSDQRFPTLYEDNESRQSKMLSSSEETTLQQSGDTYVPGKLVISIDVAQSTHNFNQHLKPEFHRSFTDSAMVNNDSEMPTESQNNSSYDADYNSGQILDLKNSVSKIFQPTNFKSKEDGQPLYEYEDYENGYFRAELKNIDGSLDQYYRTGDSKSPLNKTTSRSMQYTKSSPSVISNDTLLKNGPLLANMVFETYKNENYERVIKTLDSNLRPDMTARSSKEIHEVKQRFKKYSDKAIIPISTSSNLLIQIQKDNGVLNRRDSKFRSGKENLKTPKTFITTNADKANSLSYLKRAEDDKKTSRKYSEKTFMAVLGTIYERELLPLQQIIKTLKTEIDNLTREQIQLNRKMQRSNRPDRLIPVNITCRCHYK